MKGTAAAAETTAWMGTTNLKPTYRTLVGSPNERGPSNKNSVLNNAHALMLYFFRRSTHI